MSKTYVERLGSIIFYNFIFNIKGISWSPQYDLNILSDDSQHTFQAFAEITNGTKQEYKISRTELFGGDVCLEKELVVKRRRVRSRSRSRSRSLSNDSDSGDSEFGIRDLTPTVNALGEIGGKFHLGRCNCIFLLFKTYYTL